MACDIGPIDHRPAVAQVEIDFGDHEEMRPAFILTGDGKCLVDLPRLLAYAKMTPVEQAPIAKDLHQSFENIRIMQDNTGTYLVRAVLSALGHEIPAGPDEVPIPLPDGDRP